MKLNILAVLLLLLSACGVDSFYVESATLSELSDHRAMRELVVQSARPSVFKEHFGLSGHRIVPGAGTVLAFRAFSRGVVPLVDQAEFEKLTVFLPPNVSRDVGSTISLGEEGEGVLFWSRGSATFPEKSGCYGYASGGSILITKIANETIVADLSITLQSISPGGWIKECGTQFFKKTLTFDRRTVQQLTPWEGTPGSHLYDESIRQ